MWQRPGRQRSVLFSIGSDDEWGFEVAALQSGHFDFVHVFDCTLPAPPRNIPAAISRSSAQIGVMIFLSISLSFLFLLHMT